VQHLFNIDESRHAIERMAPIDYLASSYYERWLDRNVRLLVEKGVITHEELERRMAQLAGGSDPAPPHSDPKLLERMLRATRERTHYRQPGPPPRFASFREFYPYYLAEHSNRTSRRLHVIGTLLAVAIAAGALLASRWAWLLAVPLAGYLPAWVGHFFFEGNSPATFRHPLYSLRGDFSMLAEVITGRMRW